VKVVEKKEKIFEACKKSRKMLKNQHLSDISSVNVKNGKTKA
jgi:PII-like signaling protein